MDCNIDHLSAQSPEDCAGIAIDKAEARARAARPRTLDDLYADAPAGEWDALVLSLARCFWAKVDRRGKDECWAWTGRTVKGYGTLHYRGSRKVYAHRVSYIFEHGFIPEGAFVLHECGGFENKACVNPAHLKIGTNSDNTADAIKHGLQIGLSATEAQEIWRLYAAGGCSYRDLAKRYSVSYTTIGNIVNGLVHRDREVA